MAGRTSWCKRTRQGEEDESFAAENLIARNGVPLVGVSPAMDSSRTRILKETAGTVFSIDIGRFLLGRVSELRWTQELRIAAGMALMRLTKSFKVLGSCQLRIAV